jgi:hypothetical protein
VSTAFVHYSGDSRMRVIPLDLITASLEIQSSTIVSSFNKKLLDWVVDLVCGQ